MDSFDMLEIIKEIDGVEGFDMVEYKWKMREKEALAAKGLVDEELERYFEFINRGFEEYERRFEECAARKGIDTSVMGVRHGSKSPAREAVCA
jgi:hypothetical protein